MRREHCGNFSVAHIVMSAEVLQRAGGHPRPAPRAARCSVLPYSRGNCSVRWSRTAAQVSLVISAGSWPG
jgi:hypothetical protein